MVEFVICLCFILISIFCSSKKSSNMYSMNTTKFFKGIMALLVIISHVFEKGYLLGPLAVSIFFCISGYGLKYKYGKGGKITLANLVSLYIPFVIVNCINIFFRKLSSPLEIFLSFFTCSVTPYTWYIFIIIIIYILFSLIYKSKYVHKDCIMYIIIILMIPILYLLGFESWWFVSLIGFNIGVFAFNIKNVEIKSNYNYLMPLFCLINSVIFIYLNDLNNGYIFGICLILNSTFASLAYVAYAKKYECKNIILEKIGDYSLTMYLFHPIVLNYIKIDTELITFFITVIITYALSCTYFKLKQILTCYLCK